MIRIPITTILVLLITLYASSAVLFYFSASYVNSLLGVPTYILFTLSFLSIVSSLFVTAALTGYSANRKWSHSWVLTMGYSALGAIPLGTILGIILINDVKKIDRKLKPNKPVTYFLTLLSFMMFLVGISLWFIGWR